MIGARPDDELASPFARICVRAVRALRYGCTFDIGLGLRALGSQSADHLALDRLDASGVEMETKPGESSCEAYLLRTW